jgi:hypothetical protein
MEIMEVLLQIQSRVEGTAAQVTVLAEKIDETEKKIDTIRAYQDDIISQMRTDIDKTRGAVNDLYTRASELAKDSEQQHGICERRFGAIESAGGKVALKILLGIGAIVGTAIVSGIIALIWAAMANP